MDNLPYFTYPYEYFCTKAGKSMFEIHSEFLNTVLILFIHRFIFTTTARAERSIKKKRLKQFKFFKIIIKLKYTTKDRFIKKKSPMYLQFFKAINEEECDFHQPT